MRSQWPETSVWDVRVAVGLDTLELVGFARLGRPGCRVSRTVRHERDLLRTRNRSQCGCEQSEGQCQGLRHSDDSLSCLPRPVRRFLRGGDSVKFRPGSGSPGHPQVLTCAEEATQFTGTLPPAGPHDVIFGPGYFPRGTQPGDRESPTLCPGSPWDLQTASGGRSGIHRHHDGRSQRAVLRRTTESVVIARRKPVGHLRSLFGQAGFLSAELPIHGWATSRVRSD